MVQPGPRGLVAACGQEPRRAGALEGLVPGAGSAAANHRPPDAAKQQDRQSPEHRGPLRPGQRLLPALPGRDADLLERGLREPDQDLADAQRNKYRVIAANAGLEAGQHVLEIGTGWGGFALYAAGELGCRVTSVTISQEQYDLARQRVHAAGLDHLVEIQLRDYRDIEGTYDAIVSIEMLEAVGAEYFGTFFEVCDRALRPGGRMSLQSITFPDAAYERQRRGANWIQTYIFPGGLCPSLAVIERSTHDTQFLITGVTDIAGSYALTLRAWRERFMARLDDVRAMGFDERFIRMWEYYLALSEAGFASGISQDLQIVLEKRRGIG